nr:MAG TPA: hypothetical protein [Bacteriophage sp.]
MLRYTQQLSRQLSLLLKPERQSQWLRRIQD